MTCSVCLTTTPELQTVALNGRCPLCGADYRPWQHRRDVPLVTSAQSAYNARTRKLATTGCVARSAKLVAARLALRSEA